MYLEMNHYVGKSTPLNTLETDSQPDLHVCVACLCSLTGITCLSSVCRSICLSDTPLCVGLLKQATHLFLGTYLYWVNTSTT